MKKALFTIAFVLMLTFSMFGCSSEPNKEELVNEAVEIQTSDLTTQILDNSAKAKQDWDGKTVKYTGIYYRIFNDRAEFYQDRYNGMPLDAIDVELSQDELASLEKGKTYTVVGTIQIRSFDYGIEDAFIVGE